MKNIKNERGVTLTSVLIYVLALTVIVIIVGRITTYFYKNMNQVSTNTAAAAEYAHRLDPSRIIDHASGWHDQKVGKLQSLHVYFRPYHFKKDRLGRAVALTEFGGYTLAVPGHTWGKKRFGYKPLRDEASLADAFRRLYEQQIIPAKEKGLVRSEGKDYVMQDGDVVLFRFNV